MVDDQPGTDAGGLRDGAYADGETVRAELCDRGVTDPSRSRQVR
jgi:hypothetical protein